VLLNCQRGLKMNINHFKAICEFVGFTIEVINSHYWWFRSKHGYVLDVNPHNFSHLLTNREFEAYDMLTWYSQPQLLEDEIARLQTAKQFLDELRKEAE